MKLLAYGVIPTSTDFGIDAPLGIEGDALKCLWGEAIGLVYSTIQNDNATPSVDAALRYAQVVEYLHRRGSVLPFRFGCLTQNEMELLQIVNEHEAEYHALLDDLRDCEEMSIRIPWNTTVGDIFGVTQQMSETGEESASGDKSGTRYLLDRKVRYAQRDSQKNHADHVAKICERYFTGLVKLTRVEWQANPEVVLRLHFLVERDRTAAFADRFREFAKLFPVEAQISGPWPLYTFSITTPRGKPMLPDSPNGALPD